ncbi:MAG TPA: PASTA domain-containing protein [Gaiellaceae bacterium]|nr:PASTA domain-containing protein [Gaiellaceae bacterium]
MLGVLVTLAFSIEAGVVLAGSAPHGVKIRVDGPLRRAAPAPAGASRRLIVGHATRSDRSRPLRALRSARPAPPAELEASPNPRAVSKHVDHVETVRQARRFAPSMPAPGLSFDGISYGSVCTCAPPDTNGDVGLTQYVQSVNSGFAVYDKSTGARVLGPVRVDTLWSGLGGVCETDGDGDPIILYDQLADRWVISQFAGVDVPTDECIAVSTSSDATGSYYRYDFHLGSSFFDYPHLGVWPDGYYLTMNVFDPVTRTYLGPMPFAFDRRAMLAGSPGASFVAYTGGNVFSSPSDAMLPADLDGSTPPPAGAPEPFLMSGENSMWRVWRFHPDFASPASSTFTLGGNLTPAPYTELCPATRACIPEPNGSFLDAIGDRGMSRLAYRNFGDHESLVGNQTVSSNGVAGIRWYEIRNATSGTPAFAQQSTFQPDTTNRWLGSAAMDAAGDLAVGYSVASSTVAPGLAYAGRLASDPPSTLGRGEGTLFAGAGSQLATNNRWGDYSALAVDPVDDCTFWFTSEYYPSGSTPYNWRTRIASFRFPSCRKMRSVAVAKAGAGAGTVTSSPAGIQCGSTCSARFADGATVTLTAVPSGASRFAGWSGDCSGTGACVLSGSASHSVTATFSGPALSPPACRVPKVVGLALKRARTKIVRSHCAVGRIAKKRGGEQRRGTVVGQSPKAGKQLKAGARVKLTVGT